MTKNNNKQVTHRTLSVMERARIEFGWELADITNPDVVVSLSKDELREQIGFIVNEFLNTSKYDLSTMEGADLTQHVADDLVKATIKTIH